MITFPITCTYWGQERIMGVEVVLQSPDAFARDEETARRKAEGFCYASR
jgi:hypothetical protein